MGFDVPQTTGGSSIPAGAYEVAVGRIEREDGQFGPQAKFSFVVIAGEHKGWIVQDWASLKFSPRSKLYKWTRALFFKGASIPEDYNLSSDDLIGATARVLLTVNESGYNKVHEDMQPVKTEADVDFLNEALKARDEAVAAAQQGGNGSPKPNKPGIDGAPDSWAEEIPF